MAEGQRIFDVFDDETVSSDKFKTTDHYTKDGDRWICKKCPTSFTAKGAFQSRADHIKKCHQSHPITKYFDVLKTSLPFDELLINFIIGGHHEFSIVEEEDFILLLKSLDPNVKIPSRQTIQRRIVSSFEIKRRRLHDVLARAKSKVALTTDDWTSTAKKPYNVVTAHFVGEDDVLHHLLLDFKRHPYPHSSKSLIRLLRDVIRTSKLDSKVSAVTTDNAQSNINALFDLKPEGIEHVRCIAHVLNLVVNAGLVMVDTEVGRLRDVVTSLRSSPKRLEILQGTAAGLKVDFRVPLLDVKTRWNSTLHTIQQMIKMKRVVKSLEGTPDFEEMSMDEQSWEEVGRLHDVLIPFERITRQLSGSSYVSYSLVIPAIDELVQTIDSRIGLLDLETSQRRLLDAMKSKLDPYILLLLSDQAKMATALDPRFNLSYFDGEEKEQVELLKTLFSKEVGDVPPEASGEKEEEFTLFKRRKNADELSQYLGLVEENSKTDPIKWWCDRKMSLRRLHKIALNLLVIPATSVPSEEAFSSAGEIISKKRNRLGDDSIQSSVCLSSWMFL